MAARSDLQSSHLIFVDSAPSPSFPSWIVLPRITQCNSKGLIHYLVYRLRIDEAVILNTLHGAWIEKASEIRIRSFDTILELQLQEGKKKIVSSRTSQRNNPSTNGRHTDDTQKGNINHGLDSIVSFRKPRRQRQRERR